MNQDSEFTRRFVAVIIGVLGVCVLIDVAVVSILHPDSNLDPLRSVMILIVGSLLVLSGAVTFVWPKKGEATFNGPPIDHGGQRVISSNEEAPDTGNQHPSPIDDAP